MRDPDLRHALVAHLRHEYRDDPATLIRHELGLCAGRSRVDVAVINGHLSGFEIKSDEDTLNRLAGQVITYGKVLNRAALVTTERYLSAALEHVPTWWGVWLASPSEQDARLTNLRPGGTNPQVEPFALAQLLWRDEALAHLRARGLHRGLSGARRWFVWERLATSLPLEELQAVVCETIRARQNWSGGE